jgi:hypothetical protein
MAPSEPPKKTPLPEKPVSQSEVDGSRPEPPKPVVRKFEMAKAGSQAKMLPVWRIRIRVSGR